MKSPRKIAQECWAEMSENPFKCNDIEILTKYIQAERDRAQGLVEELRSLMQEFRYPAVVLRLEAELASYRGSEK